MKPLKTAPQILEHYYTYGMSLKYGKIQILKAMRCYSKYKSDIAYEKGYQTAINQMK